MRERRRAESRPRPPPVLCGSVAICVPNVATRRGGHFFAAGSACAHWLDLRAGSGPPHRPRRSRRHCWLCSKPIASFVSRLGDPAVWSLLGAAHAVLQLVVFAVDLAPPSGVLPSALHTGRDTAITVRREVPRRVRSPLARRRGAAAHALGVRGRTRARSRWANVLAGRMPLAHGAESSRPRRCACAARRDACAARGGPRRTGARRCLCAPRSRGSGAQANLEEARALERLATGGSARRAGSLP